jgi:autotransporter-associated beta strand protein
MGSFGANSNGFIKTNGTVTIAIGSLTVNSAFVMGDTDWTGNTASQVTALLNITGGTVNANCNIKTSPTTDNVATYPTKSTLTLNGGILNMAGHNIGTAGAGVGTGGGAINWQAGTLTSCGTINGTGGLTKTTAGTLILTGTNAWSGDTTVSGGILTVNGTISASSALTANSTTTVNGTGTISCGSTFTSATLTPGNGSTYGLLTTGDITLDSGSTYTLNLDGNHVTLDGVSVTGTYTCGSAILTISSVANPTYTTYTVVTATSISGTFNGLADGATFSAVGRSWRIHYTGTTITLDDYNPGAASNVIQALLTYN